MAPTNIKLLERDVHSSEEVEIGPECAEAIASDPGWTANDTVQHQTMSAENAEERRKLITSRAEMMRDRRELRTIIEGVALFAHDASYEDPDILRFSIAMAQTTSWARQKAADFWSNCFKKPKTTPIDPTTVDRVDLPKYLV